MSAVILGRMCNSYTDDRNWNLYLHKCYNMSQSVPNGVNIKLHWNEMTKSNQNRTFKTV